jgi:hypothetical protein
LRIACLARLLLALVLSVFDIHGVAGAVVKTFDHAPGSEAQGANIRSPSMRPPVKSPIRFATIEWLESRKLYSASAAASLVPAVGTSNTLTNVSAAAPAVQATISNGVFTKVTYNGTTYIDSTQTAYGQSTKLWFELATTDLSGNNKTDVFYFNPTSTTWNASTNTLVATYPGAQVTMVLSSAADRISWDVTVLNTSTTRQIVGYNFLPTALKFSTPNVNWPEYGQVNGTDGLQATRTNDGANALVLVNESIGEMRTTQIRAYGTDTTQGVYRIRIGTMYIGGDNASYPTSAAEVIIAPGATDHFKLSLRFAPVATPTATIAADQVAVTRSVQPVTLAWTDRRVIAAYWFENSAISNINTSTPAGLATYDAAMIQLANSIVTDCKVNNVQGVIFWDIEGNQQYTQGYSYAGDPTIIPTTNPAFNGIADQFFAILRANNVKFGMTIRNATLVPNANGVGYSQETPTDEAANYNRKISYAVNRWGASLFYIDCADTGDPTALDTVQRLFPGVLLIPECQPGLSSGYNAFSAPYLDIRRGQIGTSAITRAIYPDSFTVIWDGDTGITAGNRAALTAAVKGGDILLGHLFTDTHTLSAFVASTGVNTTHAYATLPRTVYNVNSPDAMTSGGTVTGIGKSTAIANGFSGIDLSGTTGLTNGGDPSADGTSSNLLPAATLIGTSPSSASSAPLVSLLSLSLKPSLIVSSAVVAFLPAERSSATPQAPAAAQAPRTDFGLAPIATPPLTSQMTAAQTSLSTLALTFSEASVRPTDFLKQ